MVASCCLFTLCNTPETGNSEIETADTLLASKKEILSDAGKALFKEHCAACHGTEVRKDDQDFLFTNLFERLPSPSQEYFLRFVGNSDELLKEKDPYYMKMAGAYKTNLKHQYKDKLSDKELKAIMAYLLKKNRESSY